MKSKSRFLFNLIVVCSMVLTLRPMSVQSAIASAPPEPPGERRTLFDTVFVPTPTTPITSDAPSRVPIPPTALPYVLPRAGTAQGTDSEGPHIYLAGGDFDPVRTPFQPGLPEQLVQAQDLRGEDGYWLVQFNGPITEEDKANLLASGYEIMGYVPDFTFVIRKGDTGLEDVQRVPGVRWAGAYLPAYRISPVLVNDYVLSERSEPVELTVVTFRGIDLVLIAQQIEALGGTVRDSSQSVWKGKLIVQVDSSRIESIARIPGVQWVEPAPHWELYNNKAADIMGVRPVWNTHGLYGAGQVVAVADTGLDQGYVSPANLHDDFENGSGASRVLQIFDRVGDGGEDRNSGHGTHVAGSVLGNGYRSGSVPSSHNYPNTAYVGIAPEASLVFQAIESDSGYLTGLPADLNVLFAQARGAGARIHTNSWGSSAAGIYDASSQDVDEYMWANRDFTILFAASNDGVDSDANGVVDLYSLGSPATAKNCISVGATENDRPSFTDTWGDTWPTEYPVDPIASDYLANHTSGMAAFSSRGPTLDGRFKPDIVAPGTYIASTRSSMASGTGWGTINSYYMYMGGTSMATPLAAGAATLVREYYTDQGITPSAALVKATLINGATDIAPGQYGTGATQEIPNAPRPNNVEGWGRVNVENSLYPTGRQLFYTDESSGLSTGQTHTYIYTVTSAAQPLRATLAWSDYPGTLAAAGGLVNDLDLTITGPGGTYYPNRASQRGPSRQLYYDDGMPYWRYSFSAGNRVAVRFTPTSYPVTVDRGLVFIYASSYPTSFMLKVWDDDGAGGAPGTQLFSTPVTARATGWMAIPVTGVTVSSGSFYLGIEFTTGGSPRALTDYSSTGTRSWYYNGSTWSLWSSNPGYEEDLVIRAIVKGADYATSNDRVNNVEGIDIASPAVGTYTVTVHGYNVPQGPQPYALVVVGALDAPPAPPAASFTASPTTPEVGETVLFNNTSTGSPPLTYLWNFGDGITSTLTNPTHAYTAAGTFTVTLWATNAYGSDSASLPITVVQSSNYTVSASTQPGGPTYTWVDATDGTPLNLPDDDAANVTLPFGFTFYGASSVNIRVGNNGAILFGATSGNVPVTNEPLSTTTINNIMAPFWDDIDSDTGNVYYKTVGTAPNRRFIVEWYNRPHYSNVGNATFELILYEGTNNIKFQYLDVVFGNTSYDYGASATVGIRGSSAFRQFSHNTPALSNGLAICFQPPGAPMCDYEPRPNISVNPSALGATLQLGASTVLPLTLTNSGDATAEYELVEVNGGFFPQHLQVSGGLPRSDVPVSFERAPAPEKPGKPFVNPNAILLAGAPAYGVDLLGDQFVYFTTNNATNLTNIAAATRNYYAGDFIGGDFSTLYAIDNAAKMLYAIDTASGVQTAIGASVPQSDHTWTGMAGDPTTGVMYACSTDGTTNALYTLNLATGAATLVGTYGGGFVLIDIAVSPTGQMYGVDIATDRLVAVNKATGAITAIGALGFNANYAQDMDFDEASGTLYLAAYNSTLSRAELRIANTGTGATVLVSTIGAGSGVELDAFAIATTIHGADVPWLSESPISGTIPAGGSQVVNVTLDASVVTQTGRYNAALRVLSNDPLHPYISVPVVMTVTSGPCYPVSGADFTYAPLSPVAGQSVSFNGSVTSGTLPINYAWNFGDGGTGSGQSVAHTFAMSGTYTVVMTASNGCPSQQVVQKAVTVRAPDITVSPMALAATLSLGANSTTRTLTIGNVGNADLTWSLSENPAVTWLSEAGGASPVAPNSSTNVVVTFNSAGLGVGTYNTTLRITSNDPDETQVDVPVTLYVVACVPVSGADFTYTPPMPLAGRPVTFTGSVASGQPPLTYTWHFGDGGAASGQIVVHTFATAGTYPVTLTVANACPSQQVVRKNVTAYILPDITVSPATLQATLNPGNSTTRTLSIGNVGNANLDWTLAEVPPVNWLSESPTNGTVTPGNSAPVLITFSSVGTLTVNGTYTTVLRITSNDPDENPVLVPVTLTVVAPEITVHPATLAATLDSGAVSTSTLTIGNVGDAALTWNLAESPTVDWLSESPTGGTVVAGGSVNVTVVFNAAGRIAGTYITALRITSNDPGRPEVNVPVTLTVRAADITVSPSPLTATLNVGVAFTRTLAIGNAGNINLNWSLAETPAVNWLDESPTVGVVVPGGTAPVMVVFNATGQGVGTYSTVLRVSSNDPDENPLLVPVTLTVTTEPCVPVSGVNFVYTPASPEAGNVITFTASVAAGTPPVDYTWDFGDGGTGYGQMTTHAFTAGGSHVITVTAINPCGQSVRSGTLHVRAPDVAIAPSELRAYLNPGGTTTRTLTVGNVGDASLTWSLAEDPAVNWLSESPLGGTVESNSSQNVVATFNTTGLGVGVYNTTLRLTTNDPDEPQVNVPVTLRVETAPCVLIGGLDFTYTPTSPLAGQGVTFNAVVTAGTPPIRYAWDFGDGGAGSGSSIVHTFTAGGYYTVTLTATNDCQAQSVIRRKTVTVVAPDIVVSPALVTAALTPGYATVNRTLVISNAGTTHLDWSFSENPAAVWLRESPSSGRVMPNTQTEVVLTFEATGLTARLYTTTLLITSNDPDEPQFGVPVTLTVAVDFPRSPAEDAWTRVADDGINDPHNTTIIAMKGFGSYLYATTWNISTGASVLRSTDGRTWSPVVTGGFGNPKNWGIYGLTEYNGDFYVGTRNDDVNESPQIWRSQSGAPGAWEEVPNTGLGNAQLAYWSLLAYSGKLWAGCATTSGNRGELWKYDSATTNWTQEAIPGFGMSNDGIYSLAEFQGDLYIGTSNADGAEVWRRDKANGTWIKTAQNGFGNRNNRIAYTMRVYNGVLYVGTLNIVSGAELYATRDGVSWERIFAEGFDDPSNVAIWNMVESGGHLYLATEGTTGGRLYRTTDGRSWMAVSLRGFGNPTGLNARIWGMAVFSSPDGLHLYAGTDNDSGAEIWRATLPLPEETWTRVERAGFDDDPLNIGVLDYVEYQNALYAVTTRGKGAQVWRTTDGRSWTQVGTDGFGDPNNIGGYALTVYQGHLYVGTENTNGAAVYRLKDNGVDWQQVNLPGFGDTNNRAVYALAIFGGNLYAGTWNFTDRAEVWRYNGSTWENVSPPDSSFEANNDWIRSMAVYGDYLYIGTYNADGGEIWRYNGVTWQLVNSDGQGDPYNEQVLVLYPFNGYLYAGYSNAATGAQVWRSQDGMTGWIQVNRGGFGRKVNDPTNSRILSMAEWDGYLYVGTENHLPIVGYAQNLESSNGSFTTGGGGSSWAWGVPASGPGSAHSGSRVWATNLAGNYGNNETSMLVSPEIDLRAYAGKTLTLSWWQWLRTEAGYDRAAVFVSKDGGINWKAVYVASGDVDLVWTQRSVTLDPTYAVSNFRMLFYLQTNTSNTYPGWYLDDIVIGIAGTGGEVWRTATGTSQESWEQVNTDGFSYQHNQGIWALEVFDGHLYAGTSSPSTGAEVWRAARLDIGPTAPCCEMVSVGVELQGPGWLRLQSDGELLSPVWAPNAGVYDVPLKGAGDYTITVEYAEGNRPRMQLITATVAADGTTQITHGEPTEGMRRLSPNEAWSRVASGGVNDRDNTAVIAMQLFKNYLYASTWNAVDGAGILRSPDGQTWGPVVTRGFGNAGNRGIYGLVEYNDYLYVGTRNDSGQARLYRSATGDLDTWSEVPNTGLGLQQTAYWSLLVYDGLLWAGCSVAGDLATAELWTFNASGTPNREIIPGFDVDADGNGLGDNAGIYVMREFQGDLYIGTKNPTTGAEIWRRDGTTRTWTRVAQNGLGSRYNIIIYAMEVYHGVLYVGTYNPVTGAELYATRDGNSWETVFTNGFDDPSNRAIWRLVDSNGYLYLGTQNDNGGRVYRTTDGSFWTPVSLAGFGSAANIQIWGMATFQSSGSTYLYAGTVNGSGAEIWRTIVPQPQEAWQQVERAGLDDDADNDAILSAVEYNSSIYVSTHNADTGGQVWKSADGRTWLQVGLDGLDTDPAKASNNKYVDSLAVHNGQLYAGVDSSGQGARVYRWNELLARWEQVNADGFGTVNNQSALAMVSFNGSLYASTYNTTDRAQVFRYTGSGTNWTNVAPPIEPSNWWIGAMTVYSSSGKSYLYIGTYNNTGGEIWRYDGSTWQAVTTDGFGNSNNDEVHVLLEYQGYIYAGFQNATEGGQIWRSQSGNSGTWTQVNRSGFGRQVDDPTNVAVRSLAKWNNYLYAGTSNPTTGGEIWRTAVGASQSDWEQVNTDGFGWKSNTVIQVLIGFGDHIYAGTANGASGAEIWRTGLPGLRTERFAQVVNVRLRTSQPTTITVTGPTNWTYRTPMRGIYAVPLPTTGRYDVSASCGRDFSIYVDMSLEIRRTIFLPLVMRNS